VRRKRVRREEILDILREVYGPGYRDPSVVDMGLVPADDIEIGEDGIEIEYGVTAPMCPFSAALGVMIQYALEKTLDQAVTVRITPGHLQEQVVNGILSSPERRAELLKKLEDYGLLAQCVKLAEG
jgi:metal-sulfur cluster biosynthetic enzyme